jgi:hypothetical protein
MVSVAEGRSSVVGLGVRTAGVEDRTEGWVWMSFVFVYGVDGLHES